MAVSGDRNWRGSRADSSRDTTPSVVSVPTKKRADSFKLLRALHGLRPSRSISAPARGRPRVRCVEDSKWNWRRASEYPRALRRNGIFRSARTRYVYASRRFLRAIRARDRLFARRFSRPEAGTRVAREDVRCSPSLFLSPFLSLSFSRSLTA